mgnify:CR=1 FL=1
MANAKTLEDLQKAKDGAAFVVSDLQASLKTANALEAIVLLQLISKAAALYGDVSQLLAAVNETNEAAKVPA